MTLDIFLMMAFYSGHSKINITVLKKTVLFLQAHHEEITFFPSLKVKIRSKCILAQKLLVFDEILNFLDSIENVIWRFLVLREGPFHLINKIATPQKYFSTHIISLSLHLL